jgi:O-antigen/teichoic acid export membrane protein
MATGINYPILINSNKYIWGSAFNIFLIAMTVIGNILLIPYFGMLGAAITSFAASATYNFLKFWFIKKHFHLQPFDIKTLYVVVLIILLALGGYFMRINLNPVFSICLKGLLFTLLFFVIILKTRWAEDLYGYIPARIKKKFDFLNEQ